MGYCSDVCIHMTRRTYDVVKEKYVNDGNGYLLQENQCHIENFDSEVILYWGWIKWHEALDEINYVMDMLKTLDEEGYEWCYIRHGEEYDDFEIELSEAYGWDYAHSPRIEIQW